ncbi:MAG: hypothetical protein KJN76_02130, partial [Eudoraea sp.]|nr:hypothetical protein [Eudoraea sp.]
MSACSENKNPLIRNGTSQGQRVLSKLSPGSVEIIDKSVEDWMVWSGQFSDHIRYTTPGNAPAGTMKPFFTANISAQLALVASYKPEQLAEYIRELLLYIETEDAGLKPAFTELYNVIFSYFMAVDRVFQLTKGDKEYNTVLLYHIQSKLIPLEPRAFSYYKAAIEEPVPQNLIVASQPGDFEIFHEPLHDHKYFVANGLSGLDGKRYGPTEDFTFYYGQHLADTTIFGGLSGFKKRIKYIAQHNFFTSILDEIVASATFITKHSQKYLGNYLSDWPNHQP